MSPEVVRRSYACAWHFLQPDPIQLSPSPHLFTHVRGRGMSPGGSEEELRMRLAEYMASTGNTTLLKYAPPGQQGAEGGRGGRGGGGRGGGEGRGRGEEVREGGVVRR